MTSVSDDWQIKSRHLLVSSSRNESQLQTLSDVPWIISAGKDIEFTTPISKVKGNLQIYTLKRGRVAKLVHHFLGNDERMIFAFYGNIPFKGSLLIEIMLMVKKPFLQARQAMPLNAFLVQLACKIFPQPSQETKVKKAELMQSTWEIHLLLSNQPMQPPLEWPMSPIIERSYFWYTKATTSEMSWLSSYHQNLNRTSKEAYLKDLLSDWRQGKSKRKLMKGRLCAKAGIKKASLWASNPWQRRTKESLLRAWFGMWMIPVIFWPCLFKKQTSSLWQDIAKFKTRAQLLRSNQLNVTSVNLIYSPF